MIAYNGIVSQHIGLEEGLEVLQGISTAVAPAPHLYSKSNLEEIRPITGDFLDVLIQQYFGTADKETTANVQSVKNCLLDLADKLQESVFVDLY
jgi:hypothetical protein